MWPTLFLLGPCAANRRWPFAPRWEQPPRRSGVRCWRKELCFAAAVFLAFVPRLPAPDSSAGFGLSSSGVRVSGGSSRRLGIFAVTQITASFLLLAGAGALIKTLLVLEKTQPPFETAHVLAADLPVMTDGRTPDQVRDFYREAQRRVSALPGVQHVSSSFGVPWRDGRELSIRF